MQNDNANQETATALVRGEPLPASPIDRLFIDVKRDMKVLLTADDVPLHMHDLSDIAWCNAGHLKNIFKIPAGTFNRQVKSRPSKLIFPYCLLVMSKTLNDRLIVVNWWLQLSHEQQKQRWAVFKEKFCQPRTSATRKYEYNKLDPRYRGVADNEVIRSGHAKNSRSYEIVHGGVKRKHAFDPAKSNSQVRDSAVKKQQCMIQRQLKLLMKRSSPDPSVEDQVTGYYNPMFITVTNVLSPKITVDEKEQMKMGRPSQNVDSVLAPLDAPPRVQVFGRNLAALNAYAALVAKRIHSVTNGNIDVPEETMLAALQGDATYYDGDDWPSDTPPESASDSDGLTEEERATEKPMTAEDLFDHDE